MSAEESLEGAIALTTREMSGEVREVLADVQDAMTHSGPWRDAAESFSDEAAA